MNSTSFWMYLGKDAFDGRLDSGNVRTSGPRVALPDIKLRTQSHGLNFKSGSSSLYSNALNYNNNIKRYKVLSLCHFIDEEDKN